MGEALKSIKNSSLIFNGLMIIGFLGIVWLMIFGNLSGNLGFSKLTNSSTQFILSDSSTANTILSDSSTANTLTPTEEGITSHWATTKNLSWMEFDGVNDVVENNAVTGFNGTNGSVSVWFKINGNATESGQVIFQSNWETITRIYYAFEDNDIIMAKGNIPKTSIIESEAITNVWYHVILTFQNYNSTYGNFSAYLNGSFTNSGGYNGTGSGGEINILKVGALTHNNDPSKSSIDEVRVYNKTLNSSMVSEIYNSGRVANSSLTSDGLVLWYSFNEQSGTTVYDKSGNENHGT